MGAGVTLSGGKAEDCHCQNAASESTIMVFDDSLSAVDSPDGLSIRCALKEHMREATVILISHRVTSLMGADENPGAESGANRRMRNPRGTDTENGIYRRIYMMSRDTDEPRQEERGKMEGDDRWQHTKNRSITIPSASGYG